MTCSVRPLEVEREEPKLDSREAIGMDRVNWLEADASEAEEEEGEEQGGRATEE